MRLALLLAVLLFVTGAFLRFCPSAKFQRAGFDEILYRDVVLSLDKVGLGGYDLIAQAYIARQKRPEISAELPPTRFLYIYSGWLWKRAQFGDAPPVDLRSEGAFFRDPALVSLRRVSALFTTLLVALAGFAAWRCAGPGPGLAVTALMAFAPLQIHMAQHAMIDGFFSFWATLCLWALWENFRRPNHGGWLALLALALTCLVLTKENSFFVTVALGALILLNRWARFGTVTPALLLAFVMGPLVGVVILMNFAGGPAAFIEIYRLLVQKASHLEYAIQTGDGPWHRYLFDLLIMSPLILCLALGAAFTTLREQKFALYLVGFIATTYLVMCNVRYGMNLRYATVWDWPLRLLAYLQLVWLVGWYGWRSRLILPIAVACLCVYDLAQYRTFFMENNLYELATGGLLEVVRILK